MKTTDLRDLPRARSLYQPEGPECLDGLLDLADELERRAAARRDHR